MALATRCPFCQTTFRVAQDQLKLRGGLVRCGSCKEVFNGNEHLVSPEIVQQLVVNPASANPSASENRTAPTAWPTLPGRASAPLASISTDFSARSTPSQPASAESASSPSAQLNANLSAAFASLATETEDAPWGTQNTTTPAAAAKPGSINTLTQELSYPIPLTSSVPQDNTAEVGLDDAIDPALNSLAAETSSRARRSDEAADAPTFVQKAERRARLRKLSRIVMSIGAVILGFALLLQATYVWRNTLVAWLPATRLLLSSVCATLHCSVGLPTDIEQLSLESSELQMMPPNQNIYTLTVLLRNRGYSAQAWPYMELTLNNADEKAITRRVFTPREYLRSTQQIEDGFAGEGEQQIKLTFELTQPAASGYRVYLFFT